MGTAQALISLQRVQVQLMQVQRMQVQRLTVQWPGKRRQTQRLWKE